MRCTSTRSRGTSTDMPRYSLTRDGVQWLVLDGSIVIARCDTQTAGTLIVAALNAYLVPGRARW
jgi:hypothetical protein